MSSNIKWIIATGKVFLGVILFMMSLFAFAVGSNPIPDITGSKLEANVTLLNGQPGTGEYVYEYVIDSSANGTGTIWIVDIDYSSYFRYIDGPRTFPAAGGDAIGDVSDRLFDWTVWRPAI